jgi:hypothetical protein
MLGTALTANSQGAPVCRTRGYRDNRDEILERPKEVL